MTQPRTLGKYEILDVLGVGGMGTVYRALDPVLDRIVAVKLLHLHYRPESGGDDAWSRFRTEARAVARLNHPAIVSVYDFSDTDPAGAFFVMEYVDGLTLDDCMKRRANGGLARSFELMTQLLDGLGCAHDQGVVHRDIKPSNLIVTRDGQLKITDFGIAKVGSLKQTQTGMAIGTLEYMAPEQYTGGVIDQRCDLHAAATLFFQLLAGRPPFTGTTTEIMYQICHVKPVPVSSVDPAVPALLDPVLAKALAKDPDARYQTAQQFGDAIDAVRRVLRLTAAHLVRPHGVLRRTPLAAEPGTKSATDGPAASDRPTAPPPGWTIEALAEVEHKLTRILGPLSKILVKQAAATTRDLGQLMQILATHLRDDEERRRFLGGSTRPKAVEVSTGAPGSSDPITPATLERTLLILLRYIGPIAATLVKRAALAARNEGELYTRLADRITDLKERERFVAEVSRRH